MFNHWATQVSLTKTKVSFLATGAEGCGGYAGEGFHISQDLNFWEEKIVKTKLSNKIIKGTIGGKCLFFSKFAVT